MAKCEICGKGVTFGIKVSHSHRRTNRTEKKLQELFEIFFEISVKSHIFIVFD